METVLHLSRYYPTYKLDNPPTSVELLERFYDIAKEYLDYVYLGNVRGNTGQNTYCPACKAVVIERDGYSTEFVGMDEEGKCGKCGEEQRINN